MTPGHTVALLVSRTDPERVQHANLRLDTPPSPALGWLVALAAAAVVVALALPGAGRRLQAALAGVQKSGGGRGI